MKIHFILHSPRKTGGVVVVLEHARRLAGSGHEVCVFHPLLPYAEYYRDRPRWKRLPLRGLAFVRNLLLRGRAYAWFHGDVRAQGVPVIDDRRIPDADVVIATAWPTAYSVAGLASSKGRKFYFVQGYETWNGQEERVNASYRLPVGLITIAPWLSELMRARFDREPVAEVHNGVDLGRFHPPPSKPAGNLTVLMLHHVQGVKGIPDGLAALRRLHAAHPEVRVRLFGMHPFPDRDPWMEHVRDPSPRKLVQLYQEAHVFLSPGLSEGWHLPPMEAMACGCAVVATRVGCIPALEEGGNLLSAEPGDVDRLYRHLDALVRDPGLLAETARKGRETMARYGWDAKSGEFERAISA